MAVSYITLLLVKSCPLHLKDLTSNPNQRLGQELEAHVPKVDAQKQF